MKKLIGVSALFIVLTSCNGNHSSENNDSSGDTNSNAGLTSPSANDTTKQPDGMVNGSVISTDTAAMNVQNSENKAKKAVKK
jgi:hypothetical protein